MLTVVFNGAEALYVLLTYVCRDIAFSRKAHNGGHMLNSCDVEGGSSELIRAKNEVAESAGESIVLRTNVWRLQ